MTNDFFFRDPGMDLIHFIDPSSASVDGIVALGGSLTTTNLLRAYRRGIFPWPIDEYLLPWCCPEQRAILEFKDLHIPRRLESVQRQIPFTSPIAHSVKDALDSC